MFQTTNQFSLHLQYPNIAVLGSHVRWEAPVSDSSREQQRGPHNFNFTMVYGRYNCSFSGVYGRYIYGLW